MRVKAKKLSSADDEPQTIGLYANRRIREGQEMEIKDDWIKKKNNEGKIVYVVREFSDRWMEPIDEFPPWHGKEVGTVPEPEIYEEVVVKRKKVIEVPVVEVKRKSAKRDENLNVI